MIKNTVNNHFLVFCLIDRNILIFSELKKDFSSKYHIQFNKNTKSFLYLFHYVYFIMLVWIYFVVKKNIQCQNILLFKISR
jgi:hypothetical protein